MRAPFLHFALVLFLAAPTGEGNGQQPPAVRRMLDRKAKAYLRSRGR